MMLSYKPIAIPALSQSPALIAGASLLWPPHRVRAAAFFKPLQRVRTAASAGGCGFCMHWPLPKPQCRATDSLAQLMRACHDFASLVLYESSRLVEWTLACPSPCGSFPAEIASGANGKRRICQYLPTSFLICSLPMSICAQRGTAFPVRKSGWRNAGRQVGTRNNNSNCLMSCWRSSALSLSNGSWSATRSNWKAAVCPVIGTSQPERGLADNAAIDYEPSATGILASERKSGPLQLPLPHSHGTRPSPREASAVLRPHSRGTHGV